MGRFDGFRLSDNFLARFEGKQPQWGPLGYVTFKRTYARRLPEGGTEEFWQTCQRVVEGTYSVQRSYCKQLGLPWNGHKAQHSAQRMFDLMWQMKWLPPGRGLWMMGTEFVEKHGSAALNNCGFISTRDIKNDFSFPFIWLMDMSMLGVGVGSDTRGAGTVTIREPKRTDEVFLIPDTREGWYEAVRIVLNAYVGKGAIPSFDYTAIRKAGELIHGFGGIAAGPDPLRQLVEIDIPYVLDQLARELITSEAITDLLNYIGKCVVSGNVRRSAELVLGNPEDKNFLSLKDPEINGEALADRRWASNNSVIVNTMTDFTDLAWRTQKNGEPGYYWLNNARAFGRMIDVPDGKDYRVMGANPCVEQPLEHGELCNLVENFMARCDSLEEFLEVLKYSYLYAKTVTLIPTHWEITNAVMLRNRRIGCSLSGITRAKNKLGTGQFIQWLDKGYMRIRELDKIYSEWLCCPESIKVTSVKPSGTVSLLPGEPPGVHYPHSEYYNRIIRIGIQSPLIPKLKAAGYYMEPDTYAPNSICVYFPVRELDFDRSKTEVSMWEQLELVALLQSFWADNMVSATVTFNEIEGKQMKHALEMFSHRLKSISFLPLKDHQYKQAPYQEITEAQYLSFSESLLPLDLDDSVVHEVTDKFCEGDKCLLPWAQEEAETS